MYRLVLLGIFSGNTGISDPTQLFSKLLEHGMIEKEGGGGEGNMTGPQEMKRPMPPPAATQIRFPIPKLAFTVATLKKCVTSHMTLHKCTRTHARTHTHTQSLYTQHQTL